MECTTWHVYLLKCADSSLYCGITTDPEKRLAQHNGELPGGAWYTRWRRPVHLLASRVCANKSEALKLERAIKSRSRDKKLTFMQEWFGECMGADGNYAADTIFCGHCGLPITEEPQPQKKYLHSDEGDCPFKGAVMPSAAWLALENVYAGAHRHGIGQKLLAQKVSALRLSTRTRNALAVAGIDTIGKLVAMQPYELFKQKGIHESGLAECAEKLARRGLMLGDRRHLC